MALKLNNAEIREKNKIIKKKKKKKKKETKGLLNNPQSPMPLFY